jgi:hypothetical protein
MARMTHTRIRILALGLLLAALVQSAPGADLPHNIVLFIPDGLRAPIVDPATAPAFAKLRAEGVDFANSHALFPTFTTANASALATGHLLGDTGDFGNVIYSGFPLRSAGGTVTPYLELAPVLRELNAHYAGNYLNETSILAAARAHRYSTAAIGKLGPAAIFDVEALEEQSGGAATLIVDDATGHAGGVALSADWLAAIAAAGLKPEAPGRGSNADAGDNRRPGTWIANLAQQQYFLEMTVKVILPRFKAANRPFVLVYWSRDPDGTQHGEGDSFGSLVPGINGTTSMAAIRSADSALAAIEQALKSLGLAATTNIVVAADHGFSAISRASRTSPAARTVYRDVNPGELPPGFLAIDLLVALQRPDPALRLFDPSNKSSKIDFTRGEHPRTGSALIGRSADAPEVIVAANGGSDLIYLPASKRRRETSRLARTLVRALTEQDYVSGLFVDTDRLGKLPGALSLNDIGLAGSAATPRPAIVVSFTSFSTGCERAVLCAAEVADTSLQQGQGMHGSFSRADTWNFMAARGPDFRAGFVDPLPASNADVGTTLAYLLGLKVAPNGKLAGRVLRESLNDNAPGELPQVTRGTLESAPAHNGLRTILKTQSVGLSVYWDAAGFAGRTVGLEEHP